MYLDWLVQILVTILSSLLHASHTHEFLLPGRIYCSVLYAAHGFSYRTKSYAFMRASFAALHRRDVLYCASFSGRMMW